MKFLSKPPAFKRLIGAYFLSVCLTFFATQAFGGFLNFFRAKTSDGCSANLSQLSQYMDVRIGGGVSRQTVFFEGKKEGTVVLSATQEDARESSSSHFILNGGFTVQGSPFYPLLFFGEKLSRLLGFDILKVNDRVEFRAPGAKKLGDQIFAVNAVLKSLNQEPISLLPAYAGYIEGASLLDFTLDTQQEGKDEGRDIILNSPYSDDNPQLTPHEVAFHLGAILYPKKFLKRARQISQHTRGFINYLKTREEELGQVTFEIIHQLIEERNLEFDFGTANVQSSLAFLRSHTKMSYTKTRDHILKNMPQSFADNLTENLDYFARPSMTPLEALLSRIAIMTKVYYPRLRQTNFKCFKDKDYTIGKKINLTPTEAKKLEGIMQDYVRAHGNDDGEIEISTSEKWFDEFILGLDERIEQISAALEASANP